MERNLEYYMKLPYTIELRHDLERGWFVRVKELRGCMSQGDTPEEAVAMIREAMSLWLEVSLEDGLPIPEPRQLDDYSGKFVVRLPRSLHRDLVEMAGKEGVSLNQYVNVALARDVEQAASVGNETEEARASVRQLLQDASDPGHHPKLNSLLYAKGNREEARRAFERAIEYTQDPQDQDILAHWLEALSE